MATSAETAAAREARRAPIVSIAPRLFNRDQAAIYLGVSPDTVDRLIDTGAVSVVKLPVERARRSGNGVSGSNRRKLIDRVELDTLIPKWREAGTT